MTTGDENVDDVLTWIVYDVAFGASLQSNVTDWPTERRAPAARASCCGAGGGAAVTRVTVNVAVCVTPAPEAEMVTVAGTLTFDGSLGIRSGRFVPGQRNFLRAVRRATLLSVRTSVAVQPPDAVGLKVSDMLQLVLGASIKPGANHPSRQ